MWVFVKAIIVVILMVMIVSTMIVSVRTMTVMGATDWGMLLPAGLLVNYLNLRRRSPCSCY